MQNECFLCSEPMKKFVRCSRCEFVACSGCTKRYLVSTLKPPHCMSCKLNWTRRFLYSVFDKAWLTGTKPDSLREHEKKRALGRELSKIPETLAKMPEYRKTEETKQLQKSLYERRARLRTELREVNDLIRTVTAHIQAPVRTRAYVPNFLSPCPTETCRGMIQAKMYACSLCDRKVCKKCWAQDSDTDEKHVCSVADLETRKLLSKDTKPCPQCATPIYKISGCAQMWCTQCRTPFCWKTGKIETGVIHNPHALRWQRENRFTVERLVGDVPCGGLPRLRQLGLTRHGYQKILPIFQRVAEIPQLCRDRFTHADFEDLRLSYVLNQLSPDQWRHKIFLRERSNQRKRSNRTILRLLQTLGVERFQNLAYTLQGITNSNTRRLQVKTAVESFLEDMHNVRAFINREFREELPLLGTKNPIFMNQQWEAFW